jgi:ATP-dependent Clp protease protease subunit
MKMKQGARDHRSNSSDEIWVLDFTPESAQDFRDQVMTQSQEDPNKPIIIYIDSYGGQVDSMAKMIGTLDEISNPIVTCCIGKAMSCGAILLSHGDIRFIDQHSRVMIHKVSGGAIGDSEDVANDAAEITRINKYWLGFLAENCNIGGGYLDLEKRLKSKEGRDRYLTASEAIEFGIVDQIGCPKINVLSSYAVTVMPEKISLKQRASLRLKYSKQLKSTKTRGSNVKNRKRS